MQVGDLEGRLVGNDVGTNVGTVGSTVGERVGLMVGENVGRVGLKVGDLLATMETGSNQTNKSGKNAKRLLFMMIIISDTHSSDNIN